MSNQERLKELKRKNNNQIVCSKWNNNGLILSVEDFIDVEKTLKVQEIILKKLDDIDECEQSEIYNDEADVLIRYRVKVLSNINENDEYIFFEKDAVKNGAVKLKGSIIKEKIDFLINESEFMNDCCSIFLCDSQAEMGICLWASEYDYRIYIW